MWCLQDNVQSTVRPRNLVELHIGIVLFLWSIITSIWLLFLVVKFTNCVSEKFKESKFIVNHSFKLANIILMSFLKSNKLEWDIKTLVSSANRMGVDLSLMNLGKSFTKRRKSLYFPFLKCHQVKSKYHTVPQLIKWWATWHFWGTIIVYKQMPQVDFWLFLYAAFCILGSGHCFLSLTLLSANTKSSTKSNKLFHSNKLKIWQAGSWPQTSGAANNGSLNLGSHPTKLIIQMATLTSHSAPHLCTTVNWDSKLIIWKHIATLISTRWIGGVDISSRITFTCNMECETAVKLYSLFHTKGHNTV